MIKLQQFDVLFLTAMSPECSSARVQHAQEPRVDAVPGRIPSSSRKHQHAFDSSLICVRYVTNFELCLF